MHDEKSQSDFENSRSRISMILEWNDYIPINSPSIATTICYFSNARKEVKELKYQKMKRGILATTLLIVLTLSFAQVAFYSPVNMSKSFTIADHEGLPSRGNPGMIYDNESDLIVIFGGWNNTFGSPWDSTWTYDYNSDTFTLIEPTTSPPARAEPGMAYDPVRDHVVMFGGEDSLATPNAFNDTWLYLDGAWTQVTPSTAPPDRRGHSMSFDIESDRIIIFGGQPDYKNDTWAGDPTSDTYVEMNPATAPEGRTSAAMAYDSESDRIILFGGFRGGDDTVPSNYFGDTWAYSYNTDTWEELTTTGSPSVRGAASMAYDSESDRMVLFGGSMGSTSYDQTWLFDYNTLTWEEVSPTMSPSGRSRHGSAYDWESDRVVIYGGTSNGFNGVLQITEGKIWAFDTNTNTWEEMPPLPPSGPDWILIMVVVGSVAVVLILVVIFVKRR